MSQCTRQDWNMAFGAPGAIFKLLARAASHSRVWTQAGCKHREVADPDPGLAERI